MKPEQSAKDGKNNEMESEASDESEAYTEAKNDESLLKIPKMDEKMRDVELKTLKVKTIDSIVDFHLEILLDTEIV